MQNFRNLKVWQRAHRLTLEVYRETRSFPREEMFGLTSQLRRAAGSIGANIAEGCGRGTDQDFSRFLQIAMGSASELESHLELARDLNLLPRPVYQTLDAESTGIKRMLASLLKRIKSQQNH